MNLANYLAETGTKKSSFARAIKVSPALLHQWVEGIRPVAIQHCISIERETGGRVSRKDLRPLDWMSIWPELGAEPAMRRAEDPEPGPDLGNADEVPHPSRKNLLECRIDQPQLHEVKKRS